MRDDLRYNLGSGNFERGAQLYHDALGRAADLPEKERDAYIQGVTGEWKTQNRFDRMDKIMKSYVVPSLGVVLILITVFLAIKYPHPSTFQTGVWWGFLSISAGIGGALIPGYLEVKNNWIRAGGATAIFVIFYFCVPKMVNVNSDLVLKKINIAVVTNDSSRFQNITVDFDPNSSQTIHQFVNESLGRYYDRQISDSDFTCYRLSDGMIYSTESCQDLKENSIMMISNVIEREFKDKHAAFLHFVDGIMRKGK